jgi:hypothetical protein
MRKAKRRLIWVKYYSGQKEKPYGLLIGNMIGERPGPPGARFWAIRWSAKQVIWLCSGCNKKTPQKFPKYLCPISKVVKQFGSFHQWVSGGV